MRKMKDSRVEWIGKIPNHWGVTKIGRLYSLRIIKVSDKEYPPLSVTNKGIVPQLETAAKTNAHDERKLVCKGDFAINSRSDRRGSCGISPYTGSVSLINTILCPLTEMNPRYYNWLFHTIQFGEEFYKWGHGIVDDLWTTGWQDMKKITIPILPLIEQQIIANYLDSKCSEIDALTADIKKQIEMLEEYKRSVITEAVTKGLDSNMETMDSGTEWVGKIPTDWKMRKARYMFAQRLDKGNSFELQLLSPTQNYGVVPQWKYEELSGMVAVKLNEKADLMQLKTVHKGDFCISLRSFQGGFEYSKYEGVVSPAYQVFYPVVRIDDGYYKYTFKESGFIERMNSYTMTLRDGKNISFFDFGNTYIPYPPIEEQQVISAYLDRKCTEIDSIISVKKQQLESLAEYKKSLIYEYVTGKKEVIEQTTVVTTVNPLLVLIGKILDKISKHRGKIQVLKFAFLIEYLYIPELQTQYYRYPQGPYDIEIDKRLKEINRLGWFYINIDGNPMDWSAGKNYNEFLKLSQQFPQYDDQITSLINSVGNYTENHIGHIATLFAVWNDFILDGIASPSDEQIVKEVVTNWTENKKNTSKTVWHRNLNEMKTKGIIPKGNGLHTKKARR